MKKPNAAAPTAPAEPPPAAPPPAPAPLTSMNFIKPITVDGRTVTGLQGGSLTYHAEIAAFPWVRVWPVGAPNKVRLTTLFNVADSEPGPDEDMGRWIKE